MRIMNEENRLQPEPATAGKLCNGQSFKTGKGWHALFAQINRTYCAVSSCVPAFLI